MPRPSRPEEPSIGHAFVVGVLEIDLLIPLSRSLKTKRGVLARMMNLLRKHHPISIAEVGDQDVWGRSGLAAVIVSTDPSVAEGVLMDCVRTLERSREVELLHYSIEML